MKLCISLLIIVGVLNLLYHESIGATDYDECLTPYTCGNLSVGYPFRGDDQPEFCGHPGFNLTCEKNISYIDIKGSRFRILSVEPKSHTTTIARGDLWDPCFHNGYGNTTLDYSLFEFVDGVNQNLTLVYDCYGAIPGLDFFPCRGGGIGSSSLLTALNGGFDVGYSKIGSECDICRDSDKLCIYENNHITCVTKANSSGNSKVGMRVGIGVSACLFVALMMCLGCCFYMHRQKIRKTTSLLISRNISFEPSSKMSMEKGDTSFGFGVQVFGYEELEEATDHFSENRELGDGGFGTVYYGKLQDGRVVAVKRLYENNYKRVEQFQNEVKLLARLRHINLVSLYGCTSRHSRELLLVYEYISNGTLADHLHGKFFKPGALPWPIRLNIAIEIANALTYLHTVDITRDRGEINLSTMAVNKIQNKALDELVDSSLGFESEISEVAECAFQCLQNEKDMRPSMAEVFAILQRIKSKNFGKSENLDINTILSPVSVTAQWLSTATTPNVSG
ncbi:hypothetical protein ACFE04_008923 [Oxalis oulophora]